MTTPVKGVSDLCGNHGGIHVEAKLLSPSRTLDPQMVLQRAPQEAVIWGFTAPGATVRTTMSSDACGRTAAVGTSPLSRCTAQVLTTTADPKGTWRQKLPATPASKTGFTFNISSDSAMKEQVSITDVTPALARSSLSLCVRAKRRA
eukprot:COSAG03_NODE_11324_length_599_cov_0.722000_2_plen_147_part_00